MQRSPQPHQLALALGLVLALGACAHRTLGESKETDATPAAAAEAAAYAAADAADAAAASSQLQARERREAELQQYAPAPPPPPVPMAHPAMKSSLDRVQVTGSRIRAQQAVAPAANLVMAPPMEPANTEKYAHNVDNPVHRTSEQPVSTFSIDVDTGSYSNVRRMLAEGVRPPADAVRAEEFLNYFDYGHPAPTSRETPFRVTTELAPAPWNGKRQLLMIGIRGYDVPKAELPPANLVFLIDTSGSMQDADKLPLVKDSLRQLVKQLRPQDRVSMVVYAGSAGLVLPPTSGAHRDDILDALDRLEAGGSTNGGDGIRLAYAMAKQAYIKGGVNRVILATDGDFNVGTIDQNSLETLVSDQRKSGIALTTLGFGQGNYNDELAEKLADVGDGNHAYIDTPMEARKVLVQELGATLLTIAKDVKIQVEFNPAVAAEYRLIGYENRVLNREDFANDKVDAGDIGAGHEVTALYEITPVGSGADRLPALRYGTGAKAATAGDTRELAHLRLRYKRPGEDTSRLIETPILRSQLVATPNESLRFASAVAAFADALRGGKQIGQWSWQDIATAANRSLGNDRWGQRREFVGLVEQARRLTAPDGVAVQVSE
ncbi:vWA domain-containing protein [Lysobacter solisilvae (ex Woo and Kim 2020)]|uniref:VWA domain-containing protein n=1 Tax=Agrilutibacter terrestris TaxID=2865112 RepID=A0A7H0FY68_9GAMM|nr:VWA domain-containing protein [Lysobacter terrestris]QNP40984.1 VWA domain-containing protein [Lysobacter terrestris]